MTKIEDQTIELTIYVGESDVDQSMWTTYQTSFKFNILQILTFDEMREQIGDDAVDELLTNSHELLDILD